jgi:phosphate transport system substrate-binding protein
MISLNKLSVLAAVWVLLLSICGCVDTEGDSTGGQGGVASVTPDQPVPPDATAADVELTGSIDIAGGTAHIPVMEDVQKVFARKHPHLKIAIAGGGSGVGIEQVGEGLVDIGNAGRSPTEEEIAKYGLVLHRWAIDGVTAVVNPANALNGLTQEQLVKVFAGEITNWQELGGEDKGINLYTRDEESGTREVFWKRALDQGEIAGGANVVVSNGAMKSAISQDPYGIGYVSVGHVDDSVKALQFNSVAADLENVKSGAYPVARGLYSLTKGEPAGAVKEFLDFLYSPEGQEIIAAKGFIAVER